MFTPESTVDIQLALGSDILMVLDECLPYPVSQEMASKSVDRTVGWARSAFRHYQKQIENSKTEKSLFPIVPGIYVSRPQEGLR